MTKHKTSLSELNLKEYCLFLDRDGVINEPIVDDYARKPEDLVIAKDVLKALKLLSEAFKYVIVVTNQQGIGRELMSIEDLENVHLKLRKAMKEEGIKYFDSLFYAPYLRSEGHHWRKPGTGMVKQAKNYFPDIDPKKCILVGDSPGDMALAGAVGALKVRIVNPQFSFEDQDLSYPSLYHFAVNITQN